MAQSRRNATQTLAVNETTHAGLWLDKYIDLSLDTYKDQLVKEVTSKIRVTDLYAFFYKYWKESLTELGADCREAEVQGRLAINLGAEAVLETSIALHHTYGVPFIPGSALKGLAAHYSRKYLTDWGGKTPAYEILFGTTKTAGYVTFFDALYVPDSGYAGKALWADVITVHHPDYYQAGNAPPPPADWDSPDPIPFISATGRYLIALAGPKEWVVKAFEILAVALEQEGIGAKTSSGYGRMKFIAASQGSSEIITSDTTAINYHRERQKLLHERAPAGRLRGTVTDVHDSSRYAKINPAGGGPKLFVHINQVKGQTPKLVDGQIVEYKIGQYQGKPQAQDVTILLEP